MLSQERGAVEEEGGGRRERERERRRWAKSASRFLRYAQVLFYAWHCRRQVSSSND
jgi:hypothetical protein